MLPSQILLNNLLYDTAEMTIPTDRVDAEHMRPRRTGTSGSSAGSCSFRPISSVFDFATFAVMLWVFDAAAPEFRSGWFVESLATQTLIVFVIRTHRVPFWRSRPSRPLTSDPEVVAVGAVIPFSPLAETLGFTALPAGFFAFLVGSSVLYLVIVELAKRWFYRGGSEGRPLARRRPERPIHHRASRWTIPGPVPTTAVH